MSEQVNEVPALDEKGRAAAFVKALQAELATATDAVHRKLVEAEIAAHKKRAGGGKA